jgi:ankyrin repeat protein
MKKKLLLVPLALFTLILINAEAQKEIKNLAQKYVVLKKLRQNALNAKLIIAARMRKDKMFFIDLVKKQGAQINAIDLHGKTALIHAVILKDYETATILLELGISTNIKDSFGKTALEYAYENNDTRMIALLESFEHLKLFKHN